MMQAPHPQWSILDALTPTWLHGVERKGPSATLVGHKIFVMGGIEHVRVVETRYIFILDVLLRKWSHAFVPRQLDGRQHFSLFAHTGTLIDDRIFFIGGFVGTDDLACSEKVFSFDIVRRRFSVIETFGNPKRGAVAAHSADLLQETGEIIVFGGKSTSELLVGHPLFSLDTKSMRWNKRSWKGHAPSGRVSHASCLVDKRLYIFGGFIPLGDAVLNDLHVLDLHWSPPVFAQIQNLHAPQERFGTVLFHHRGQLYVMGGDTALDHDDESRTGDLHRFDIASRQWYRCDEFQPPPRRSHHKAVYLGDRVLVFGGTPVQLYGVLEITL